MLRQLGLEDRVRAKSLEMYSETGGIIAVESLAGRELATYVEELNEGVEGFSPTRRVFINQDVLEPLLRERALELGATVRNRTEAVGLEQDDDGATVTLRDLDSGDEREVRTRYVVAADGNRSPMRGRLGIAHARLRTALAEHHHLLPRRLRRAAARSQPGRDLRAQPGAARVLPARPHRGQRLPRHQHGRRGRHAGLGDRRAVGADRGASARRSCAPRSGPTCRWRSWTSPTGTPRRTGPSGSATVACSSRATPRTSCRRTAASAATPASRTRSTSPGSSPRSSRATPGRPCSTATRPSACR